jgi:hypothetical protein
VVQTEARGETGARMEGMVGEKGILPERSEWFRSRAYTSVAPQLTVVTNTTVQSSVAVPVSDARAARVVPSVAVAHETTTVRALSSNGR